MTITEMNKLIADFMYPDWEDTILNDTENTLPFVHEVLDGNFHTLMVLYHKDFEALNYHKSWNELMPVIEKILNLPEPDKYKQEELHFQYWGLENIISTCDKELIYNMIINFLKTYNNEQKRA